MTHTKFTRGAARASLVAALFSLAGCDLGPIDGVYGGTLSGDTSPGFRALFLEDDSVWIITGTDLGSSFQSAELWQGTGSAIAGSFPSFDEGKYSSDDIRNFGAATTTVDAPKGELRIHYTGKGSERELTGTAKFTNAAEIQLTATPLANTSYDYDSAAALSDISGSWTLTNGPVVTLTLTDAGALTWANSASVGCSGTGTVKPRASGKNVFDVSIVFAEQACQFPAQTVTGIALSYPVTSTGQRQLIVALVDAARTHGAVQAGIR